jgi:hypothetical protein
VTTTAPAAAARYMADPQGSVSFNGAMPGEGSSSSGASPVYGHAITGSSVFSSVIPTTMSPLAAGNAVQPPAPLPTDVPMEKLMQSLLRIFQKICCYSTFTVHWLLLYSLPM